MMTTLGLLAALVVIPVLIRFGTRLFARLFVRAAVVASAKDIGQRALEKQSDRIHLVTAGPQVWAQPDAAGALATPLLENGFEDAGTFAIPEMPGVHVRLLVDARNCMLGIVYEHPRAPHWLEILTRYTNGGSCSFTTLRPTGLSPRPGHPSVHAPGIDAGALLHRTLQERPSRQTVTVTVDSAAAMFESGYAEYMAWRKRQGVSAKEVLEIAERRAA
jgi:hypothetical protein